MTKEIVSHKLITLFIKSASSLGDVKTSSFLKSKPSDLTLYLLYIL